VGATHGNDPPKGTGPEGAGQGAGGLVVRPLQGRGFPSTQPWAGTTAIHVAALRAGARGVKQSFKNRRALPPPATRTQRRLERSRARWESVAMQSRRNVRDNAPSKMGTNPQAKEGTAKKRSARKRKNPRISVVDQVMAIFRELGDERADQLAVSTAIPNAQAIIREALTRQYPGQVAHDIAFHLTDWQWDAAFIVALLLFPERFTPKQIRDGVERFAIHAPNHTAAAAKLCGWPVADIFEVGALDSDEDEA
jgi:hypothetical protein